MRWLVVDVDLILFHVYYAEVLLVWRCGFAGRMLCFLWFSKCCFSFQSGDKR